MAPLTVNVASDVHTAINRLNDASLVVPRCILDLKNEVEEALRAEAARKKPSQADNQSPGDLRVPEDFKYQPIHLDTSSITNIIN